MLILLKLSPVKHQIIIAIVFAFLLLKGYVKTKGHLKAKIFHFISTIFILAVHIKSLGDILLIIFKFQSFKRRALEGLSNLEGTINLANNFVYAVVSLAVLYIGVGLYYRSEDARKMIIRFALYLIPITTIYVYMRAKQNNDNHQGVFLLLGLIGAMLIYGSISYIYKLKFMTDFFNTRKK